jgi:hypothetical protein
LFARIVGEHFYIYASKAKAARPIWSVDLRVATPPKWMLELAEQVGMIEPGTLIEYRTRASVLDRFDPVGVHDQ